MPIGQNCIQVWIPRTQWAHGQSHAKISNAISVIYLWNPLGRWATIYWIIFLVLYIQILTMIVRTWAREVSNSGGGWQQSESCSTWRQQGFMMFLADFCWWGLRQVTSLRSRQFTMCSPETPHKCTLQKEIYLILHLKKCFETWTSLVAISNGDAISYVANTTDKIYEYEWSATKNAGQKYSKHHYSFKPCVCLSTNEIELYVSKN